MKVLRRPLFLIFISLVVFISIWYHFMETGRSASGSGSPPGKEPVICVGRVDEIQMVASGKVLVLSDVQAINTNSENLISATKMLVYESVNNGVNDEVTNTSERDLFLHSRPGNKLRITGTYLPFMRAGNPGEFDELLYYEGRGIDGKLFAESLTVLDARYDRWKNTLLSIRQRAVEQLFTVMEEADAGLLAAMIFGKKTDLPEEEKELYQKTGIGHMLVISGLHISLLAAAVFFFLRSHVMPMSWAVAVTIVILIVYGQFTGFQVATMRAVIMMCCALLARYTGRSYDPLSALSLSGILTLIQEPAQLFQCGFLLSYTAVFGILMLDPVMERLEIKNKFLQSVLSSASVSAVTLPVMLWFYYEICPYSVLANVLVLPFLSMLVGLGMTGGILLFFWPVGGGFVLATTHYILKFYDMICRFIQQLPMSSIVTGRPPLWGIVLYYAILGAVVVFYLKWEERKWLYTGAAALFVTVMLFRPNPRFLYTQLDVGQGDCACIFYGDETILIDGGSSSESEVGKHIIQKFLKFYGRTRIDWIFVSHSDADHTNGIVELVENQQKWELPIGGIVMPEIQKEDDAYQALLQVFDRNNTKFFTMKKGDCLRENELLISCLHPAPAYVWESENDYSLTLEIDYRDVRILCTGDLEESGEKELPDLKGPYDLLKVGHHGSKTSTSPEFVQMVSPANAVISAGRNNRYGHPAEVTLQKLEQEGSRIWNTMWQGAIFLQLKNGKKKVYSYWDGT